jgi:hypothetical protein
MNPYKIFHAILTTRKGTFKTFHSTTKDEAIKKALKHAKKGQRIYCITDKQFGLIQNSCNGKAKTVYPPFSPLYLKSGKMIKTVPLTISQLNNVVIK